MSRKQQKIDVEIINPERLDYASKVFTRLITKYWWEDQVKKTKSEEKESN
jgi:hypothetical protein